MKLRDYIFLALVTESTNKPLKKELVDKTGLTSRLTHSLLGIGAEKAELMEAIINDDEVNVFEELGDILWFSAIGIDELRKLKKLSEEELDQFEEILNNHIKDIRTDKEIIPGRELDIVKASMFYEREIDYEKVKDVIRGALALVNVVSSSNGYSVDKVMKANINKLNKRYGDKFDKALANHRDLQEELKAIEKEMKNN